MTLQHPGFFERQGPFSIGVLTAALGVDGALGGSAEKAIATVAPLSDAGPDDLSFLDNRKYRPQLQVSSAGACLLRGSDLGLVPDGMAALVTDDPYRAFARAIALFYPGAWHAPVLRADAGSLVDPTARIEDGAIIEPGAMIGAEAQIGRGARICGGAVVGYRCTVGRDSYIGANSVVVCTMIGDRVILHAGVRTGQDGFGFSMGRQGHLKVPQIGRVIIQDDVEIGAGTTIDRGALKDTIIGEGTKIDNLVQIGHNVILGRHCVIVAQVGISGSTELGDFVVMGGHSGAVGHIKIGSGTQIAGASHVKNDVAPGSRMGGTPARPLRQWAREIAAVRKLGGWSPGRTDEE